MAMVHCHRLNIVVGARLNDDGATTAAPSSGCARQDFPLAVQSWTVGNRRKTENNPNIALVGAVGLTDVLYQGYRELPTQCLQYNPWYY
jgi:hypothetical protein